MFMPVRNLEARDWESRASEVSQTIIVKRTVQSRA